jgi:hypothetical protein|nr:MAG TPA: hypothetical protein [Caudoviricetes sp.]DAX23378.1 MAG TPA: hypothetical protein [Caudoviricetes sp.]
MFDNATFNPASKLPYGETKEVTYFCFSLIVPEWTRYIMADCDGSIFATDRRPRYDDKESTWLFDYGQYCYIGDAHIDGDKSIENPRATLIRYKEELPIEFSQTYEEAKPRRVQFKGMYMYIPSKYTWMAHDANGEVWAFNDEPSWFDDSRDWDIIPSDEYYFFVGTLTDTALHTVEHAKQSKMKIKEKS